MTQVSPQADKPHPPCRRCGKPVERREGETLKYWYARVACSRSCGQSRRHTHQDGQIVKPAPKRDGIGTEETQPFAKHNLAIREQEFRTVPRPPTVEKMVSSMWWAA